MKSLRILHVASHRINVGDGALIAAIQEEIARCAGILPDFTNFDIVNLDPRFGGATLTPADLDGYDLVLVGGGGTIDNRRTHTASGMAFPLSGDAIRRLTVPLAYVGVGYNLFGGTRLRHGDALADVIQACAEREFPFSVRNDGSLSRLRAAIGDAARSVVEIPDPGFFVRVDPDHIVPAFSGHTPRVLVQVAGDNPGFRFSRGGGAGDLLGRVRNRLPLGLSHHLTAEFAELVRWLVEEQDAEVVLAPHIAPDLPLVAEIAKQLPARIARKRVRMLGVPDPNRAAQFFAAYAQSDLVIGMRGHSVIAAVGLGTPCVAVSSHPKVAGFMSACGLDDWTVQYGRGMSAGVRRLSAELMSDPSPQHRRREAGTAAFRRRFEEFMQRCWHLAAARRG